MNADSKEFGKVVDMISNCVIADELRKTLTKLESMPHQGREDRNQICNVCLASMLKIYKIKPTFIKNLIHDEPFLNFLKAGLNEGSLVATLHSFYIHHQNQNTPAIVNLGTIHVSVIAYYTLLATEFLEMAKHEFNDADDSTVVDCDGNCKECKLGGDFESAANLQSQWKPSPMLPEQHFGIPVAKIALIDDHVVVYDTREKQLRILHVGSLIGFTDYASLDTIVQHEANVIGVDGKVYTIHGGRVHEISHGSLMSSIALSIDLGSPEERDMLMSSLAGINDVHNLNIKLNADKLGRVVYVDKSAKAYPIAV